MGGAYDTNWRIIATKNLAVNSSGGATTSTTSVGAQTRAVDLVFSVINSVVAATAVRFLISDSAADSITSVTGGLLPANTIARYAITPGQKIQAVGADTAVANLVIMELSK